MRTLLMVALALGVRVGNAGPEQTDKFFQNLAATTGEYHQATVALLPNPQAEPKDMEMHELANTLRSKKLSKDKYLFELFNKGDRESEAAADLFERKNGEVLITHHDLDDAAGSFRVVGRVGGENLTEVSYYLSDVTYLDNSAPAKAARKESLQKRQLGLAGLVLALALLGERVPADIIQNEDWIEAYVVNASPHNPIVSSNVLLDPKGKSERRPKGEPNLTILQIFHAGH